MSEENHVKKARRSDTAAPDQSPLGKDTSDNLSDGKSRHLEDALTNHEAAKNETTEAPEFRNSRGRLIWLAVVGVVFLTTITLVAIRWRRGTPASIQPQVAPSDDSSSIGLSQEQRAAIAVEVVQKHRLQSELTTPGKIVFNGNRVTPIFSQFSGRIIRLTAEIGSNVRAGEVIGMIETPDIVASESDYQQALTSERSAHTTLDLATRTRERSDRLASAEAIPKRDLQQAVADEARASDDLKRAESAVAAARGRLESLGISEKEIKILSTGSHAVNRVVPIVAPIGGTITERKAGSGQVVQAGAGDPLFVITDLSTVWVSADVYEDQLAHIRIGEEMSVTTPAYPNETFSARVDQIGSMVDSDKHTVSVRCVVGNAAHRLKPGMFASIVLDAGASEEAITVPTSAIVAEGDRRTVFIEESPGKYRKHVVEIGNEVNGATIVRAGLKEGDRVVMRGGLLMSNSGS